MQLSINGRREDLVCRIWDALENSVNPWDNEIYTDTRAESGCLLRIWESLLIQLPDARIDPKTALHSSKTVSPLRMRSSSAHFMPKKIQSVEKTSNNFSFQQVVLLAVVSVAPFFFLFFLLRCVSLFWFMARCHLVMQSLLPLRTRPEPRRDLHLRKSWKLRGLLKGNLANWPKLVEILRPHHLLAKR